ncbi:hypothetical protein BCR42DRAFT_376103 [Absidia repens]|uniref:F-box domain-containing protein n=1 Tax=Absidia repens TaxID=90262 RepID=A0A1X2IFX8_9FUNG|nr:hypothetical protein BCR42DRAFT_376103 [Absidia repens]
MDITIFPPEITQLILEHLPIRDLIRAERTCKLLQLFCLSEIERRIKTGSLKDEFGVLIHLGQAQAEPQQFDPVTKTVQYIIPMDPITFNTMYDHRRNIHCSLLRKQHKLDNAATTTKKINYLSQHGFTIPVESGLSEGKTIQISVDDTLCQLDASLTRILTDKEEHGKNRTTTTTNNKKLPLAPLPLSYSLQVTGLRLPLSTIATYS